jgi:hypothetical protein
MVMEDTRNEIRFYGMKPNKSLRRQVERQIGKWILRKKSDLSTCAESAYRVCIERENGGCLCCHLEVQVGSQSWEAHDVGRNIQEALFHSLQHLSSQLSPSWMKENISGSSLITKAIA